LLGPQITETSIPLPGAAPNKLVYGPDGAVWFSEANMSYVARWR